MSATNSRVWLVDPYCTVPGEGWQDSRYTMLGRQLAAVGYDVTWWTANYSHQFKRMRGEAGSERRVDDNFRIRFLAARPYKRHIGLGRLAFENSFARNLGLAVRQEPPPTCIVCREPSQFACHVAKRLAKASGAGFIVDVFDLWPELFVTVTPRWLKPLARVGCSPLALGRRAVLRAADGILAVSQQYLDWVTRLDPVIKSKPSAVVYIGIDLEKAKSIMPTARPSRTVDRAKLTMVHAGTIGSHYDVRCLLQAAELLRSSNVSARLVFVGRGPMAHRVEEAANGSLRGVVEARGVLPMAELFSFYQTCDVGVCSYIQGSTVSMPTKFFDYLVAGLPILNSLAGEVSDVIRREEVGFCYQAGNPESLVAATRRMLEDPDRRSRMSKKAERVAERYDVKSQYPAAARLVEEIIAARNDMRSRPCP